MRLRLSLLSVMALLLASPAQASGERLFTTKACIACHVLKGHAGAKGTMGPDLSKLFKAKPPRDPKAVSAFLQDPWAERPGIAMPDLGLSREEADALTSYLLNPRSPTPKPSPSPQP